MSNRFPLLSAPIPCYAARPRGRTLQAAPRWLRSLPLGEMLVLGAFSLLLTLA